MQHSLEGWSRHTHISPRIVGSALVWGFRSGLEFQNSWNKIQRGVHECARESCSSPAAVEDAGDRREDG